MPRIADIRIAETAVEVDLDKAGTFVYRVGVGLIPADEPRWDGETILDWLVHAADPSNEPEVLTLADGFSFGAWEDDDFFTLRVESLTGSFPEVWSVSFLSASDREGEDWTRFFGASECINCPPEPIR